MASLDLIKIITGGGFIFLGVILIASLFLYGRELRICGLFLKYAGQFIASSPRILFVVPTFIFLNACLLALCLFQLLSYWSSGLMVFDEHTPYYRSVSSFSFLMTIINFIGLYWGFSFLN
jgi:hypothetical protein